MTLKLVTREAWGAKPSRYTLTSQSSAQGVKVHYEGSAVPDLTKHASCAAHMRALQASHLANTKENYSDIAYNFVVCPHGYVFEGRGLKKRTGANGNPVLNGAHCSVCAMLFNSLPTDLMLHGIRDAIEYMQRSGGAGREVKGHRDGYATTCPGDRLYAWVRRGAPRPDSDADDDKDVVEPPKVPAPVSGARGSLGAWPGASVVAVGKSNTSVRKMQLRLRNAIGATQAKKLNPNGATGYYGTETKAMVRYALRNRPETWNEGATSHDGRVGSVSWKVIDKL